jgi:peptidoglycan hydrolase-like protein with peptidoglycan-binding domain
MTIVRPTTTRVISSSWADHRKRTPPSQEPGTDYACAYGSTVVAPADGTVVAIQTHTGNATGRFITIDFDNGQRGRALHLSQVNVGVGQRVKQGQKIGVSGASANGKEWGVGAHVHQSLFNGHSYNGFGPNSTVDFEAAVVSSGGPVYDQTVANEQNYLNAAQGEKLVVDGILGDLTKDAIKRYQSYLKSRNWYNGEIDGVWGPGTQQGHEKRYAEWVSQTQTPPQPQYHNVTLDDIKELSDVRGLQKIANLYLKQTVDNQWGPKSKDGLSRFLNQNYGGSLTAWLRQKWGYVGNEQWGPQMKAALVRANDANFRAL